MKLVLIGIPGAGKSTQGNLLSQQLKIPYLSTGHIFREIAKEKTKLGQHVKVLLHAGLLISDEKTIEIVENYLSRSEYSYGYILDGFPRTLKQAKRFKNHVDKVIYLEISDKEALWRLASRSEEGRNDNTVKAVKTRLDIFHKYTEPVIRFYEKENKFVVIDGTRSIEEVNKEILNSLGKQLVKNQITTWKKRGKTILAITGLPGSGKTEAGSFFEKKAVPVISFEKIINDYISENKLKHTVEQHAELISTFRKKYGMAAFAILNEKKIRSLLNNNAFVVIDGMQSWEEYEYVKKTFKQTKVLLLTIHADKLIRYARISKRPQRSTIIGEKRDLNELIGAHMGPTIAYCDFLLKNNFSIDEFQDKLEQVYRSVQFG